MYCAVVNGLQWVMFDELKQCAMNDLMCNINSYYEWLMLMMVEIFMMNEWLIFNFIKKTSPFMKIMKKY